MPRAGQIIGTQLRLVAPLDGGAMGSVWIADHRTLKTQVAVKFVGDRLEAEDPAAIQRFRHEAAASARIKSPHVAQVFDHDTTEDGAPYIVMELLEGETLRKRLDRSRLSVHEAVILVTHVSRALARAHAVGVIHRDIKPENIFLCRTGDDELFCKLFDFGIAKQVEMPELDGITSPGLLVGTPEFMSPETFFNKKGLDHHADLWALAVTTYYSLVHQLPFDGESFGEVCTKLLTEPPTPIQSLRADISDELAAWFDRALDKKPENRFADAKTFARTFAAAAEGNDRISLIETTTTRPTFTATTAPGDKPSSRPLVIAAAAGVLLAAAVAFAIVSTKGPAEAVADGAAPTPLPSEPPPASAAPVAPPTAPTAEPVASASATPEPTASASAPATAPPPPPPPAPGKGYDWAF